MIGNDCILALVSILQNIKKREYMDLIQNLISLVGEIMDIIYWAGELDIIKDKDFSDNCDLVSSWINVALYTKEMVDEILYCRQNKLRISYGNMLSTYSKISVNFINFIGN